MGLSIMGCCEIRDEEVVMEHAEDTPSPDLAELFETIAFCATKVANALRDGDAIAGTLASDGLLTNLGLLPPELKTCIAEALA
jgi:hypothetical protein